MLPTTIARLSTGRLLRIARVGTGPPIILLHGYPDNLQIWSELAIRLADRFEVVAFDWPGMGYSEGWPGGTTPFHMAERLHNILDELRLEQPSVVGMDMGGQPALVFAAKYPERIDRLVVMNSLVMWDENTSWEIAVLRKFGWNRFILRRFPRIVFWRAETTFLPSQLRLPTELRADLWNSFSKSDVRLFIARLCAGYQGTLPELTDVFPKIKCPTLVLWGEEDKHFPPDHAKRLNSLVPGSSLKIISGATHWMAWYLAEQVTQAIRAFLNGPPEERQT